jgi:hypothetical protein
MYGAHTSGTADEKKRGTSVANVAVALEHS